MPVTVSQVHTREARCVPRQDANDNVPARDKQDDVQTQLLGRQVLVCLSRLGQIELDEARSLETRKHSTWVASEI